MFEVTVTFIVDGVAEQTKRMVHPPAMGDHRVMSTGKEIVVIQRIWTHSNLEHQSLDLVCRTVAPAKTASPRRKR